MKDILLFNTYEDGEDLNDYRGHYNIFMLCNKNLVTFVHGDDEYYANGGDIVVWPRSKPCDDIYYPEQMDADVLLVSDYFLDLYRPETVWDYRGYKYLDKNPVIHTRRYFTRERATLEEDFKQLARHLPSLYSYQGEEIFGSLLRVFLYDIWAPFVQMALRFQVEGVPSGHFAQFLEDVQENCRKHRDVAWYAAKRRITPKYLTEVSRYATGRPAGDWIEECAARVLRKELSADHISLTDLSKEMNFSSLQAFSRYVKHVLGCSPSEFRDSLKKKYTFFEDLPSE
jgi:AraC-like DNA-binding protein